MVNLIMSKGQKLNNLGTFILHDFQEIYARFGPAAVSAGVAAANTPACSLDCGTLYLVHHQLAGVAFQTRPARDAPTPALSAARRAPS